MFDAPPAPRAPALLPWTLGSAARAPIFAIAIGYILPWHAVASAGFKSPLMPYGEAFSYCCHAGLFFALFSGVAANYASGGEAFNFYRQTFARIYPLFLLGLICFWGMALIDSSLLAKGSLLLTEFLAEDLLTLWFISIILLFYLAAPLFLSNYSLARTAIMGAVVLVALGAFKVKTGLVDVRLCEFLLIFMLAVITGQCTKAQAAMQSIPVVLMGLAGTVAGIYLTVRYESHGSLAALFCTIPMLCSMPVFLKLNSLLTGLGGWAKFLGFTWFCAFLLHRLVYTLSVRIFQPETLVTKLALLLCLGIPLTLAGAYVLQKTYARLFAVQEPALAETGISV